MSALNKKRAPWSIPICNWRVPIWISILLTLFCGAVEAQTFAPLPALSFVKHFSGADPLPQTISVLSAGANFDFSSNATTVTGGNWLSATAVGFNCCATPRALTVAVTAQAGMATGTYSGQITLTSFPSGAAVRVIPVTLTIEPDGGAFFADLPGQLSFTHKTGPGGITSQNLQIRNGGSGTLNWTLAKSTSDGGSWLTVSASAGTAPAQITVGVAVANLPGGGVVAGHFAGQIVLSQPSGGSVTIPVSVVVDANTFSQINGISFTKVFGGTDPLPQTLVVASTGTNFDFDTNSYTANGGNWLSATAVGFNCCATPRAVTAVVTTSPSLAVGTYTGQIVFTVEGNGATAITVPVTLTVEPPAGTFFNNLPGALSFSLKTGGSAITSQTLQVRNGGSGTLNWTLAKSTSDGGNWLTVSASTGAAPSQVTVGVSVADLPGGGVIAGHFTGQLVFSQPSGGSVTIPVSVVVDPNAFSQINGISFTKVFGGADPLPQTLMVASTGTNFDFDTNSYTANGGNWLSATAVGFNCCATPRAVTAVVTTSPSLAVGTYSGQIVFTAEGNGSMAITVPVTLTVEPPTGTFFDNLPGELSFTLKTGGNSITSQTFQVRNAGSGTLDFAVATSTADGGSWLSASPTSGRGPSLVTVTVSVADLPGGGLIAGHFVGQIVLSQPSGGGVTIPVSVVVDANAFAQINGINFTKVFGGADPLPQTLTVASTGTNFDFETNSYTATGGNWLSATAVGFNCCATPRAVTAVVTTSPSLAIGTYTGQIVFTAEGNGSMAITVPVTLTVEPANGTFLDDVQGQASFSLVPGGGNPPLQDVQIRGRGTETLNWTIAGSTADGGSWLTLSAAAGTTPSTVHVGVIAASLPGGGLVAGTFIGNLVISSASSTTTIPVSVTVGTNVFVEAPTLTFTKMFGAANPPSQDVTIASTGSPFDFDNNSYTATGGNWLSVTVAGFNCCATPRAITANIIASPTLPVGTYTGQIVTTVEGNGSSAMTIPVILTVLSSAPSISSLAPNTATQGQTISSVAIVGQNTHFVQGTTAASFGANITVNSLTVTSATSATANITVQNNAALGARTVTLTTGAEVATLSGGFTVTAGSASLSSVTPNTGGQGQTIASVAIVGQNTNFVQGTTTANFGSNITVNSLTVNSATSATANITVQNNAALGSRTVTLTTGAEVATLSGGFTVTAGTVSLSSVTPNTGAQGQTISNVAIVGQNTNFAQGTTVANFGANITVNSLTVNSTTSATANITVQNNAALGARTVTLTTGAEVATRTGGFTVTAGAVSLNSVTPNTGAQGQTINNVAIVGQNTNFVQGTTVANFGANITVNSLTVSSATSATANITIQNNAALGARTVTLTTGAEVASKPSGFTVTAGTVSLSSVTPNTGAQGQTIASVAIVGQNTNFVQGTTTANFGANITVNSLTVSSATSATANITIQNNAALGARIVTLTTGAEVATKTGGFTVTAGTVSLSSVTPNTGAQGQTINNVAIVGQNTNFVQGTTVASFGANITVNSLMVSSPTSATANITVQNNAAVGARTVTLTTGAEVATKTGGFTVTAGTVSLSSVTPNTGAQGQTINSVAIIGQNTNFVQGTTAANFGANITVNSLTVNSTTSATANITVQNNAALGARTVTLSTGAEVATKTGGFTVTAGTVSLSSVTPNTGAQGQTINSVAIVGQNTNFVQGTTTANFGANITVNSLTVNSATSATANITVQNNAALGARMVTLTTGSEVATKTGGFTVTAGTASLSSITPNTGVQGQTIANVAITGQNTNFVQGTTVANFGANITVNSLTVSSARSATANITVQNNAAVGARTVTLTTGSEVATKVGGFTVAAPLSVVSFRVLFGSSSYDVAAASNTRVRLPWQITGVEVVFSHPVVSGSLNSLGGLTATAFSGLGTNTLTWTFNPISLGSFVATLAGGGANGLSDANGFALGAGAGYTRALKVLWGDFNDDGSVSAADLGSVNNARVTTYNVFADMNGDGIVDVNDVQIVRTRIGTSLQ